MHNDLDLDALGEFDIAIVGMAGRFPGADNLTQFWDNLCRARESIAFLSDQELQELGTPASLLDNPDFIKAGGLLADADCFDAEYFGYASREAEMIDPQQRIFLECAHTALEDSGHHPDGFAGLIGVYAGASLPSYLLNNLMQNARFRASTDSYQATLANEPDFLATRVSFKLNLQGPSVDIQTACSTSLVAVHFACQALLNFQCDMALAGGVSLRTPQAGYLYQEGGILSPDGHCRAFDADAQGTVPGNGCGVVVLRRLKEAVADGDHIHAVIKASAINNDGSEKMSFTAPSPSGQAQVIRATHELSEVDPETIGYIECHGTGTALGDPAEISGLTQAFRAATDKNGFCAIGSLKPNIGHLDAAAGIAGLIKATLALEHRVLPPSINYTSANASIDFSQTPFYVNDRRRDWAGNPDQPLRAGVSSFGIGGTNAHVLLEQAPLSTGATSQRAWHALLLSAKSASALQELVARMGDHLSTAATLDVADAAYTLQLGRSMLPHRCALVCSSSRTALEALAQAASPLRIQPGATSREGPTAFLFPGQGAQFIDMGRSLYQTETLFRDTIDHCAAILETHLGMDLRRLLYPASGQTAFDAEDLNQTALAQPAIFSVEYALVKLLESWGIRPAYMLGHSLGELVAACCADVMSLDEALYLVAERGRLMQSMPAGAMLSVAASAAEIAPMLPENLSIAASNAPDTCVLAGPNPAIQAFAAQLDTRSIFHKPLRVSHAFHSPMMQAAAEQFENLLTQMVLRPPRIPFLSNTTGTWITEQQAISPAYWARQMRLPVRFDEDLKCLLEKQPGILIEMGPGSMLSKLARRAAIDNTPIDPITTLCVDAHPAAPEASLPLLLSRLWCAGAPVDWARYYAGEQRLRISLPTYPFERRRYWIPADAGETPPVPANPSARRPAIKHWFHTPLWRQTLPVTAETLTPKDFRWLVFAGRNALSECLTGRLTRDAATCVTVQAAADYASPQAGQYQIRPQVSGDWDRLLNELADNGLLPDRIIYLWTLPEPGKSNTREDIFNDSFLHIMTSLQALGRLSEPLKVDYSIVTNNAYCVHGDDALHPEQALVSGACRVAPLEYPDLSCRQLDIDLRTTDALTLERIVAQIIVESVDGTTDSIVTYRHTQRWIQQFEPMALPDTTATLSGLKQRGTYLISGGLGSLGLAVAEYLATNLQANIALLHRYALEGGDAVQQDTTPGAGDKQNELARAIFDERRGITEIIEQTAHDHHVTRLADRQGLDVALDRLAVAYIGRYLAEHINIQDSNALRFHELAETLAISEKFGKFLRRMLVILERAGLVGSDTDDRYLLHGQVDTWDDPVRLDRELRTHHPQFTPLFDLMQHCAAHLTAALSSRIDPLSVLYPDGSADLMRATFEGIPEFTEHRVYHDSLGVLISRLSHELERPLRILEVGAGTGSLTWRIAPQLDARKTEYHFTDIGRAFVVAAQKRAQAEGYPFMTFGIFDIDAEPLEQGLEAYHFDIILAVDVIHATPSIRQSVHNLQRLLQPGGALCMVETVTSPAWLDLIQGFAEGWWYFTDQELRSSSPLLAADQWRELLEQQGFASVRLLPDAQQATASEAALIIALQPEELTDEAYLSWQAARHQQHRQQLDERLDAVERLRDLGSEVITLHADVTDPAQLRQAVTEVRRQFGKIDGIIHSAGIAGGGLIQLKHPDTARALIETKMQGALLLDQICDEAELMVLFSSVNAVVGTLGQIDHCAANAFLDAFAHYRTNHTGRRTVSINWSAWKEIGQAASIEVPDAISAMREKNLQLGLSSAEGIEAFHRIVNRASLPQALVLPADLEDYRQQALAASREATSQVLRSTRNEQTGQYQRPNLNSVYVAPESEIEEVIAELWQEVLGIEKVGIHDNFFELGGHSLIAMQLAARIREAFEIEISLRSLLETPTVASISGMVEEILMDEIEAMSDTKVEQLIKD